MPYLHPCRITVTPLYTATDPPKLWVLRLLGRLIPWHVPRKLRPGKSKKPKTLEQYHGGPIANDPLLGAKGDAAPSLQFESVTPGYWLGEAATVVLLELHHTGEYPIPQAVVEVFVKAVDDAGGEGPVVVGAGPFKMLHQPDGSSATVHGGIRELLRDIGSRLGRHSKPSDHSRGSFTAAAGRDHVTTHPCDGVKYDVRSVSGNKDGIPTSIRSVFVYKFEGDIQFGADMKIKGTTRTLTIAPKKKDDFVWSKWKWLSYQNVECTHCEREGKQCQDFSHPNQDFWYSLLHQPDLDHPVSLPYEDFGEASRVCLK